MVSYKKLITAITFSLVVFISHGQEKVASFDPGEKFYPQDICFSYLDNYRNNHLLVYQSGNDFVRLLLDSAFTIQKTHSFSSKEISYYGKKKDRKTFLNAIAVKQGLYEIFAQENTISIYEPGFVGPTPDSMLFNFSLRLTDKDERLLAIFPAEQKICFLSAAYKRSKLILYKWDPVTSSLSVMEFDLPDSNMDKSQYKEYPKETRITFHKHLFNPIVVPLGQTALTSRPGPVLYYSDSIVHILMLAPYFLGPYTLTLDTRNGGIKTHNYLINDLRTNAGTNNYKIKYPTACIFDSLLIIKNLSASTYEYLFYNVHTNRLIKKYEADEGTINSIVHSSIRQKGTWGSKKEEKEFEKETSYLKKGGGFILPSAFKVDSITLTNISIIATTGVTGTLLDFFVPLPIELAGVPLFITSVVPPLGPRRDKIIYFHSKFSIPDLTASTGSNAKTVFDDMVDDSHKEALFEDMVFVTRKGKSFYIGCFSKKEHKIHVYQYIEK